MDVVILVFLHKNIYHRIVIVLIDEDGVAAVFQLNIILKGENVQLVGRQLRFCHGAGVVGGYREDCAHSQCGAQGEHQSG